MENKEKDQGQIYPAGYAIGKSCYRYYDNFEREQGFPGLKYFGNLEEAYAYLLEDGKGAILFQCDGIEMERKDIPIPLSWLRQVIEDFGYVEVQIGFSDRPGKDIWISCIQ